MDVIYLVLGTLFDTIAFLSGSWGSTPWMNRPLVELKTAWTVTFEEELSMAWCPVGAWLVVVYHGVDTGAEIVQLFHCDQRERILRKLMCDAKLEEMISTPNNRASVQKDLETLVDHTLRHSVRCVWRYLEQNNLMQQYRLGTYCENWKLRANLRARFTVCILGDSDMTLAKFLQ